MDFFLPVLVVYLILLYLQQLQFTLLLQLNSGTATAHAAEGS